jgi:hypothetical protein
MTVHVPRLPFALDPLIREARRRARQRRALIGFGALLLIGLAIGLTLAFRPFGPGGAYSPQQVERAFKAEGIPLRLTDRGEGRKGGESAPVSDREVYYRSLDNQFSVIVFEPARMRVRFDPTEGLPPQTSWARNVVAYWTPGAILASEVGKIRAVLNGLAAQ